MGLNSLWQDGFLLNIQNSCHQAELLSEKPYYIINCNTIFFIHLIPIKNQFKANELVNLQTKYQEDDLFLVQLWQDVWLNKRDQVISRIRSFLGLNKSFHGRKTKIVDLSTKEVTNFLNSNHLQGYISAKYNYGLVAEGEIIAAANFSFKRLMKFKDPAYFSAELIRFASKDGITIVGGLSKLIKHFLKEVKINDLMTYADRDWSLGKGYDKIGFELTEFTEPSLLYLDQKTLIRYFPHRLPQNLLIGFKSQDILNLEDYLAVNSYIKIFNTGNLKYHLYQ